jgi:Na+/H+ antiporter NhaD/arsenite permease-like protein
LRRRRLVAAPELLPAAAAVSWWHLWPHWSLLSAASPDTALLSRPGAPVRVGLAERGGNRRPVAHLIRNRPLAQRLKQPSLQESLRIFSGLWYWPIVLMVLVSAVNLIGIGEDNQKALRCALFTTVLLIAPVTLLVCDRLAINAAPFLMAEAFASNIGGTATLVGDPPNIIISSKAGLSFNDFLIHLTPIVIIVMVVLIVLLPRLFPGAFTVDPERVADVMSLEEKEAIRNPRLLIECGVVLVAVFAAFIGHSALHMEPSIVALLGAGILVVVSRLEHTEYLSSVEWETLLFFAGLFVMVGALVKTGVMKKLAHLAITATGGNVLVATMVILVASMLISGFVNNVPYAAAMTPIVGDLAPALAGHADPGVLWWSLALGTDFGGNLTAVGASANVIVIGMAARSDNPISFGEFTRKGAVVTTVSVVLAATYLYLRDLMVS